MLKPLIPLLYLSPVPNLLRLSLVPDTASNPYCFRFHECAGILTLFEEPEVQWQL
jgi:hypothetical protein